MLPLTDRDVRDMAISRLRESVPLSAAFYSFSSFFFFFFLFRVAVSLIAVFCSILYLATVADSYTILGYLNLQLTAVLLSFF